MTGFITLRHVCAHPLLISREFGIRVLARCVWSALLHRNATFLDIAGAAFREATPKGVASLRVS